VQAKGLSVLLVITADFILSRWNLEILIHIRYISVFGTYQGASIIMGRVFDWMHSRISMLDVDVVPQSSKDMDFKSLLSNVVQHLDVAYDSKLRVES
jgi:hypothetical protein